MRIDNYLSDYLGISRKDIKSLFKKNIIYVNDILLKDIGFKVNNNDIISYNGEQIIVEEYVYYILNKPKGYVSSTINSNEGISLLELVNDKRELKIVGRLDKDTEGLIIITNDGDLIHEFTSPKKSLFKTYYGEFSGEYNINKHIEDSFKEGFILNGEKTLPGSFEYLGSNKCLVSISEGRFHQVKLMCEAFGLHIEYLKRIKIGNLELSKLNLGIGEYLKISKGDLIKEVY